MAINCDACSHANIANALYCANCGTKLANPTNEESAAEGSASSQFQPEAGWAQDPSGELRYWDGTRWTISAEDYRRRAAEQTPNTQEEQSEHSDPSLANAHGHDNTSCGEDSATSEAPTTAQPEYTVGQVVNGHRLGADHQWHAVQPATTSGLSQFIAGVPPLGWWLGGGLLALVAVVGVASPGGMNDEEWFDAAGVWGLPSEPNQYTCRDSIVQPPPRYGGRDARLKQSSAALQRHWAAWQEACSSVPLTRSEAGRYYADATAAIDDFIDPYLEWKKANR